MASVQNKLFLSTLARRQRLQKSSLEAAPSQRSFQRRRPATLPSRLATGLAISGIISLLAYRRKSLSRSGAAAALATGTVTFGGGGWPWSCTMLLFFATSSLLSHWKARQKEQTAADKFSKGSQRDLGQVVSNGGVATLLALGYGLSDREPLCAILEAGYVGALATANADTWATEIGVLSPQKPRLITTGQVTSPGTSGGITPLGTAASAAGALLMGSTLWLCKRRQSSTRALPLIALCSGLAGSFFDSFLGATAQAMFHCPNCDKQTEKRVHSCGTVTRPLRGLSWDNNDTVNFLATLFGSLVAIALWLASNSSKKKGIS